MTDIISSLTKKKATLLGAKRKIQEDAKRQCDELDIEIKRIDDALQTINDAAKQFLCPSCGGSGEEYYTDAAGSRDTRACHKCNGTGIYTGSKSNTPIVGSGIHVKYR